MGDAGKRLMRLGCLCNFAFLGFVVAAIVSSVAGSENRDIFWAAALATAIGGAVSDVAWRSHAEVVRRLERLERRVSDIEARERVERLERGDSDVEASEGDKPV